MAMPQSMVTIDEEVKEEEAKLTQRNINFIITVVTPAVTIVTTHHKPYHTQPHGCLNPKTHRSNPNVPINRRSRRNCIQIRACREHRPTTRAHIQNGGLWTYSPERGV